MESVRLTRLIRDSIWFRIKKDKFSYKEKNLQRKYDEFYDLCYTTMYSVEDQKFMNRAPEGAFKEISNIFIRFSGLSTNIVLKKAKPIFHEHRNQSRCQFTATHPLTERFYSLDNEKKDLKAEQKKAAYHVFSVLNSVATTKRLAEVWPEITKYIEETLNAQRPFQSPAVPVAEVNRLLGL